MVLDPGEVDDLLDELGQPLRLPLHAAAEAFDGLRIVGEVGDRLGEEGHRTDRSLELVRDVGDEVPADRVDALGLGLVVAEDEDERGAQRGHAGVEVAEHGLGGLALLFEVDLLDEPAGAHPFDDCEHLRRGQRMAADETEGVGGRGGLDDVVAGIEDDGRGRKDGEHLGDALGRSSSECRSAASRERSLKRNASMPAMPSPRPTMPVRTATIKRST